MIPAPRDVLEIFLQPGECYFGEERTRISTLLGSCVAITLWHGRLRIGGMCHYLLPERPRGAGTARPDGRYADEAIDLLVGEIARAGTRAADYQAKVFGGGHILEGLGGADPASSVPGRNIARARELLARMGVASHAEDLGGTAPRFVMLDLWSGDVWVRRGPPLARPRA